MLKKGTRLCLWLVVSLSTVAAPSFAATVKVTDTALEPATVTVGRGEEIVWVDATTGRTAQVNLHFGREAGPHVGLDKDGNARARFEEPGTYDYHAHTGAGGWGPRRLDGTIVVK